MRVFLDDERPAPEGWTRVRWPEEAIRLLEAGGVTHLSLDHDLGEDARTGYDVVLWLEEAVALRSFSPPRNITVHSANSSARVKMVQGIQSTFRLAGLPVPDISQVVVQAAVPTPSRWTADVAVESLREALVDGDWDQAAEMRRWLLQNAPERLAEALEGGEGGAR